MNKNMNGMNKSAIGTRRNHYVANFCRAKESNRLFIIENGEHRITVLTEMGVGEDKDIRENIIVKEKADDYRYSFILQCEHVTPQLMEQEKRISFLSNDTGEEVFFIPASFMTDARGEVSADVSYKLTDKTTGVFRLTITANSNWMNAQKRVFPVTIEPQMPV